MVSVPARREQVAYATGHNVPVILPISGRRWKSITVGTRSIGVVSKCTAASSATLAALSTLRWRPAW